MSAYEEKVQARLERLRARAAARRAAGEALVEGAHRMAAIIPLGQPIMIGHHSEKRDRNYRGRIDGKFRKGFEALGEARDLERRVANAEANTAISSDDPDAVVKLRAKLADIQRDRTRATEINATLRTAKRHAAKAGVSWEPVAAKALADLGVSAKLAAMFTTPDPLGNEGIPAYRLTNLASEARRIEARIKVLENQAARPARESVHVGGISVEESDNRVRVLFPGKPKDETRALLKRKGFRWSPTAGAWQRQATDNAWHDAVYIARDVADNASAAAVDE